MCPAWQWHIHPNTVGFDLHGSANRQQQETTTYDTSSVRHGNGSSNSRKPPPMTPQVSGMAMADPALI